MISEKLKSLSREIDLLGDQITESLMRTLLQKYPVHYADILPWETFSPTQYTRNLIRKTYNHEMLCCCWLPGQFSPIHDHVSSSSYVAVLSGIATEHLYDDINGKAKLKLTRTFDRGTVYGEAGLIHSLGNQANQKHNLITLHIYAPPLPTEILGVYQGGRIYQEEI